MDKPFTFTRINVFRADYSWLIHKFGNDEARPAQGVLVARARDYIASLENELETISKVVESAKHKEGDLG